jgi:hypothetical protein
VKYTKYKSILRVSWIDAAAFNEWLGDDEIEKKIDDDEMCCSIGYYVGENKNHLCLAGTCSNDKDSRINELNKIPKKCIKEIKCLTK